MSDSRTNIQRRFDGAYGALYDGVVSRPAGLRVVSIGFGFDTVLPEIPRLVRAAYADAPTQPLLDVPCGAFGSLAHGAEVAREADVVGVDLADVMLDRARTRIRELAPAFSVQPVRGDALELPFDDESFGAALSINGLHCLPDHARFVQSVARVLQVGGTFTLTTLVDRGTRAGRGFFTAMRRAHILPITPPAQAALDAMLDETGFDVIEAVDGRMFVARRLVRR
ncbi:MAG: Ubiquinone/menaquinone biosynthesis methyl transferase [Thermoleophilia bacterium]|nr:Ubiquinone/menaquinone biosynthesis methyl transferase [Thermoleophilia bacterium]